MNLFTLDTATILALLGSVIIPAVSQLIARAHWSNGVVGLISLTLAAINGFVSQWADATDASHYNWQRALGVTLMSYILTVLAHYGLWRNTEVERKLRAI